MTNSEIAKSSPALNARIAGIVYLINGMTYGYADGNHSRQDSCSRQRSGHGA